APHLALGWRKDFSRALSTHQSARRLGNGAVDFSVRCRGRGHPCLPATARWIPRLLLWISGLQQLHRVAVARWRPLERIPVSDAPLEVARPLAPRRRVVLLGASNLTKGIGTVLETSTRLWGG